jgi:hypothetical protein
MRWELIDHFTIQEMDLSSSIRRGVVGKEVSLLSDQFLESSSQKINFGPGRRSAR